MNLLRKAPDWARFAAINSDATAYFYEFEPIRRFDGFKAIFGRIMRVGGENVFYSPECWEHSLIPRIMFSSAAKSGNYQRVFPDADTVKTVTSYEEAVKMGVLRHFGFESDVLDEVVDVSMPDRALERLRAMPCCDPHFYSPSGDLQLSMDSLAKTCTDLGVVLPQPENAARLAPVRRSPEEQELFGVFLVASLNGDYSTMEKLKVG